MPYSTTTKPNYKLIVQTTFHLHEAQFDNLQSAQHVALEYALHGSIYNVFNDPRIIRVHVVDASGNVLKVYKNVDNGFVINFFDTEEEADDFFNEKYALAEFPRYSPYTKQWLVKVKDI